MSKIVEKWVAGFWSDSRLFVVKWKFRETPKKFAIIKEDSPTYREAALALGFKPTFRKDSKSPQDNRLFDTWAEALAQLLTEEMKGIQRDRDRVNRGLERVRTLSTFSDKMGKGI